MPDSKKQGAVSADLKTALQHAGRLLQGNPALAEQQAAEILRKFPNEPNALQLLGSAQRRLGKLPAALQTLQHLISNEPEWAAAYQERGLLLAGTGQRADAIRSLRKAVDINPSLTISWKALGDLLAGEGDEAGSRQAYQQHLAHSVRDPILLTAANHLYEGRLARAEHTLRSYLKKHPTDVTAIRLLAATGMKLGQFEDAAHLLERCLELAPDFRFARSNHAYVLFKQMKYQRALEELNHLLKAEPENPNFLVLKSSVLVRIGRFREALDTYEQVLERFPNQAQVQMSYGHTLKTVGRVDEAIKAYRTSIQLSPGLGEAYWSLANLKTFKFEGHELATMIEQADSYRPVVESKLADDDEETPILPGIDENSSTQSKNKDHFHLCFSLGKALEDNRDYDRALEYYRRGNASKRKAVFYDADENHRETKTSIEFFTREFFENRQGHGCLSNDPIFIVGLPRSGSTLLEQILASHSQVEGTMELPDIIALARRLGGRKRRQDQNLYPTILADLTATQLTELGEEYIQRTTIQRTGKPFFTDKMPNNFFHIGFIKLILPNARIIDARRHPLACCLSGYKQLFARGQTYTYDLAELGRYYRDYVDLMDHWDRVLPDHVLKVQYENVVHDIESQVARILDYCGLPFEEKCLEFHNNKRAVRTASSEQVRQPLYAQAVDHWHHFRQGMNPLVKALGPAMAGYADL